MKCKKKIACCTPVLMIPSGKNHYVCAGISKKPSKYKEDIVWLCLQGKWVEHVKLEMTKEEAQIISACLNLVCADDRTKNKG